VPHGTYVQFGNRGDKLIATYHGDHAYTFDVTASEQPPIAAFCLPAPDEARCHNQYKNVHVRLSVAMVQTPCTVYWSCGMNLYT
jgi:hypothetical protein